MDLEIFENMEAPELRKYVAFLLRHYRVMDAFWFIYVAERFDQATAERLNEQVWSRVSSMGARDILSQFEIREKGLKGFSKALKYWPWSILVGYEVEAQDDQVIITVPSCPTQEARLKRGDGEFVCKEMHRGEFARFAQEVDGRIRTECILLPRIPIPRIPFVSGGFL